MYVIRTARRDALQAHLRAHKIDSGIHYPVPIHRQPAEPCGLSHLCAMQYKTLPIARATGGLIDTVTTYQAANGDGTGFLFHNLRPDSLANTIGWAVSTWYQRPAHIQCMRHRIMAQDHSWDRSAHDYVQLYVGAYAHRRGHAFAGETAVERQVSTPVAAKPASSRVVAERPFEPLSLPARHARAPVGRRSA